MHPGSTPHAGDDRSVSPQEKSEASVHFLSEGGFESALKKESKSFANKAIEKCCSEILKLSFTWSITSFFADLHIILAIRL